MKEGQLTPVYKDDFSGGVNLYLGVRQLADKESPNAINCDFKGRSGVGNRKGYSQIGAVADSRTKIYGMDALHTTGTHQLIKFASNGSNVALYYSTNGGAWTAVTGTTFTDSINVDVCQAGSALYSGNGTDTMVQYAGSSWAAVSNGTKGYFPTYFDKRIWVADETNLDTLNFSGQWATASSKLGDFTDATAGTITLQPGSGKEITAIRYFRDALYVFCRPTGIYRITPATAANTFNIELLTDSIGCVSHRSVAKVEEDLYFAAEDGIYSIGEVANYNEVRTTNKSGRVQNVFDGLTSANKSKLVGIYHNFKYHLYYSLFGTNNDSCLVYDIRYRGWQDWRTMAASAATLYTDSTNDTQLYFGEPTTGEVHKMYSGTTDDGSAISTTFYTKSFDEDLADLMKLYFDHTFTFGALNGAVTCAIIFNDSSEVSVSESISQLRPQGGLGRDALGRMPFGDSTNTTTSTDYRGIPLRIKAKGQKFAVQYRITSSGDWRLDAIGYTLQPFSHFKFPSQYRLN